MDQQAVFVSALQERVPEKCGNGKALRQKGEGGGQKGFTPRHDIEKDSIVSLNFYGMVDSGWDDKKITGFHFEGMFAGALNTATLPNITDLEKIVVMHIHMEGVQMLYYIAFIIGREEGVRRELGSIIQKERADWKLITHIDKLFIRNKNNVTAGGDTWRCVAQQA